MKQRIPLSVPSVLIKEHKKKGNIQEDLAQRCDVTKSTVSKWEIGKFRSTFQQLPKIIAFYDITIQKLLNESDHR